MSEYLPGLLVGSEPDPTSDWWSITELHSETDERFIGVRSGTAEYVAAFHDLALSSDPTARPGGYRLRPVTWAESSGLWAGTEDIVSDPVVSTSPTLDFTVSPTTTGRGVGYSAALADVQTDFGGLFSAGLDARVAAATTTVGTATVAACLADPTAALQGLVGDFDGGAVDAVATADALDAAATAATNMAAELAAFVASLDQATADHHPVLDDSLFVSGDLTSTNTSGNANADGETVTMTDPFGNGIDVVATVGSVVLDNGTPFAGNFRVRRNGTALQVWSDPETDIVDGQSLLIPVTLTFTAPTNVRLRIRDLDLVSHSRESVLLDEQFLQPMHVSTDTRLETAPMPAFVTATHPELNRRVQGTASVSATNTRGYLYTAALQVTTLKLAFLYERLTPTTTASAFFVDFIDALDSAFVQLED